MSAHVSHENIFYKNPEKNKQIALTFDDGPHPRYTQRILEILNKYNIKATFFIIGVNAQNYPESLRAISDANCEIANHTFSHKNIGKMSEEQIVEEILLCEQTIFEIIGKKTVLFRPPEGNCVQQVQSAITKSDYDLILWSIDTKDWAHTPASQISNNVLKNAKGGDIILMHDYTSGVNTTCPALEAIIPKLLEEGYEFVTVSELIK